MLQTLREFLLMDSFVNAIYYMLKNFLKYLLWKHLNDLRSLESRYQRGLALERTQLLTSVM